MARKITVALEDDLDGGLADELPMRVSSETFAEVSNAALAGSALARRSREPKTGG